MNKITIIICLFSGILLNSCTHESNVDIDNHIMTKAFDGIASMDINILNNTVYFDISITNTTSSITEYKNLDLMLWFYDNYHSGGTRLSDEDAVPFGTIRLASGETWRRSGVLSTNASKYYIRGGWVVLQSVGPFGVNVQQNLSFPY